MEGKEYVEPSYYAVIPSSVRYDNELKPNEKLLYGEITALCDKLGYCWATNDYFAKLYNVSRETVSRWVNHLVKKGYLFSQIIYKENSSEILNRVIKLDKNLDININNFYRKRDIFPIDDFVDSVLTKKTIEHRQKNQESIDEKIKENNTSINNTSNNIKENIKRKVFKKPTLEELKDYCISANLKVDIQYFYDYYESNGWKVGKNSMKDWKATLRNWNRNNLSNKSNSTYKTAYERTKENMAKARKELEARNECRTS